MLEIQKKQLEAKLASLPKVDENEIIQIYDEFQRFMNWEGAPDIDIDIYTQRDNDNARVSPPTPENPKFTLHVYHRAKVLCQNNYKALLFHEFAHIFDCITLDPVLEENGAKKIRSWYSEANGVVIALMCLCNFKNIREKKCVNLDLKIGYCDKEITIDEYFSLKFNEIQRRVDSNNYENIIKPIQYYLGCWRFYSIYCTFSVENYSRLSKADYLRENFDVNITRISRLVRKYDLSPDALKNMLIYNDGFKKTIVHKIIMFKNCGK